MRRYVPRSTRSRVLLFGLLVFGAVSTTAACSCNCSDYSSPALLTGPTSTVVAV